MDTAQTSNPTLGGSIDRLLERLLRRRVRLAVCPKCGRGKASE